MWCIQESAWPEKGVVDYVVGRDGEGNVVGGLGAREGEAATRGGKGNDFWNDLRGNFGMIFA
jgi:hypothetical protein